MKSFAFFPRVPSTLLALLVTVLAPPVRAQTLTQQVLLQPGWNAVWLEVDPPNRDPSVVFSGLPLASVWTWSERVSAADFIQSPESTGWNRAQWLAYFPSDSPEAPLANLYAVLPQRAYLVRLAGTQTVSWSITGRPSLRTPAWIADRYNLRGFPVDDSAAPTFRQFFRPSPAHYDLPSNQLEAIFRLSPDGQWHAVAPDDPMRRGEAYWVYTRGLSDYIAPFHLALSAGDALEFHTLQRRIELSLHNALATPKTVRLEPAGTHGSPLLLLPPPIPGQTNSPRALGTHDQPVAASTVHRLHLGLDRSALADSPATDPASGVHATVLRISDGEGTQFHIAVSAVAGSTSDFAGLWLGSVTITNVVPVVGTNSPADGPGPVSAGFPLRLLIHVDDDGHASLLRDITLVYARDQSLTNPAVSESLQPTELVTDPSRLASYSTSDIRSGEVRGRRLTAPHFDFARTNGQFALPLTGVFAPSNSLTGTLLLPGDVPTNPFLHRYHPDHTNGYTITRDLTLALTQAAAPDPSLPDLVFGGAYAETISGLHRLPLRTSGSLELRRISNLGVLNTETP